MKSLALLLLFIGIILVVIGYTKNTDKCPKPKVEYRFVPRSFFEEQLSPDNVTKQFQNMFGNNDPWLSTSDENKSSDYEENTINYKNFYDIV